MAGLPRPRPQLGSDHGEVPVIGIRHRWDRATDRLPLRQVKAADFVGAAWAYRGFWLFFALVALAMLLAGCATDGLKSSVAGSCAVFERPPYAVRGATQYDQDVADKFVESGVAGCNWARPAARPPQLDRAPAPKPVAVAPAPRRKGIVARIKHKVAKAAAKITGRPAAPAPAAFPDAPVAPVTAAPVVPEPPPAPPKAPPERSRIEQLLRPNG